MFATPHLAVPVYWQQNWEKPWHKKANGSFYYLPAAGEAEWFIPNIFYHEVQVPTYPLFDYPPYETALASTMVDVIKNNNLDLLHVHYAIPHASAAYMAKQILKKEGKNIPVITTLTEPI